MKMDDRIILYLDNQMTDEEKIKFEAELNESSLLKNQLQNYQDALRNLTIDKEKYKDSDYFVNLIPKFRNTRFGYKKKSKVKIAYALSTLAAIIILVLIIINPFKTTDSLSAESIVSSLSENEAIELLNYYTDEVSTYNKQLNGTSDSLLTVLITSEFNLQETDLNNLLTSNEISIESIYSELEPHEAELIYQEILNKKYF
jgi:hypothetical protein